MVIRSIPRRFMDLNISYTRASESLPPGTQTPERTGADEARGLAGETQDARTTCQPCTPSPSLSWPYRSLLTGRLAATPGPSGLLGTAVLLPAWWNQRLSPRESPGECHVLTPHPVARKTSGVAPGPIASHRRPLGSHGWTHRPP